MDLIIKSANSTLTAKDKFAKLIGIKKRVGLLLKAPSSAASAPVPETQSVRATLQV